MMNTTTTIYSQGNQAQKNTFNVLTNKRRVCLPIVNLTNRKEEKIINICYSQVV